ncbi:hypothetical protein PR048_002572 [Dryococelus australis]|uniref:Uncharacterized protein n=1 Tax=Dryococelus australis TaxID=614101 RepID=A0ABQ9IKJ6_9NEOP|nr:hypothetical protein PR048_002572 [Dryococelus australis]
MPLEEIVLSTLSACESARKIIHRRKLCNKKFCIPVAFCGYETIVHVALITTANDSAVLEPVVNALKQMGKHITGILDVLKQDLKDTDRITDEILKKAQDNAMELEIEISVPHLAHKQNHRSNPPSDNKCRIFLQILMSWMKKNFLEDKLRDTDVIDLFNKTNIFFPAMRKAL